MHDKHWSLPSSGMSLMLTCCEWLGSTNPKKKSSPWFFFAFIPGAYCRGSFDLEPQTQVSLRITLSVDYIMAWQFKSVNGITSLEQLYVWSLLFLTHQIYSCRYTIKIVKIFSYLLSSTPKCTTKLHIISYNTIEIYLHQNKLVTFLHNSLNVWIERINAAIHIYNIIVRLEKQQRSDV